MDERDIFLLLFCLSKTVWKKVVRRARTFAAWSLLSGAWLTASLEVLIEPRPRYKELMVMAAYAGVSAPFRPSFELSHLSVVGSCGIFFPDFLLVGSFPFCGTRSVAFANLVAKGECSLHCSVCLRRCRLVYLRCIKDIEEIFCWCAMQCWKTPMSIYSLECLHGDVEWKLPTFVADLCSLHSRITLSYFCAGEIFHRSTPRFFTDAHQAVFIHSIRIWAGVLHLLCYSHYFYRCLLLCTSSLKVKQGRHAHVQSQLSVGMHAMLSLGSARCILGWCW